MATRALPAGPARERYRHEFIADLHTMTRPQQATYTLGLLANTWALRAAVADSHTAPKEATMNRHRPLGCLLNMHHKWHTYSTEDGGNRYRRCARCGKEPPYNNGNSSGTGLPVPLI